ncbi:MAG: hypothetical protein LJE68_11795 [Rhodobacter sp.]|nr:hypothetical protein [Rhodobacter sp.]
MTDDTIRRNANGSIDTNHYMALGRQARSDEAYRLAGHSETAVRRCLVRMRAALRAATANPPVSEIA